MKTISIGKQSFSSIREKNNFYIDKTDFIREWWEADDAVTLIPRPRRFGKTLNMDMLNCFFSKEYEGRSDLFEGLSIWKRESYRELQGTYPVIFLSFAAVKMKGYTNARKQICELLYNLYEDHRYLLEGNLLSKNEKTAYEEMVSIMDDTKAATALQQLMKYLSRYYKKNVIILLDEYDTPLQEAYVNGYWDEMTGFIRSLFNSTFKTNPYLERAVMTGITRVSKESIFSDLNNLKVVTTTSSKYGNAFGFTEEEVFNALDDYDMGDQKEIVKKWYDGFTFGKYTDIYNPWSITNYLDEGRLGTYWANTSSNSLISNLIQQGSTKIKVIMEDLLKGKSLFAEIDEEIIFSQLNTKENAIWSLMLTSGYLKVLHSEFTVDGHFNYELGVTNFEVQIMLKNMIRDWFGGKDTHYNDFVKALLQNDKKAMNYYMNKVAIQTFSYFDTGNKPSDETEPERFYHGFVLGLIVDLSDRYHIISNRESGFGRYDVVLEPIVTDDNHNTAIAYILEFKVYDEEDEQGLQDTVESALRQIEEKRYDADLLAKGFFKEQIRHYGFAFRGKEVLIG
ncbi:MAG: ATP-binding protein [Lachnospiraceae bacterium]|nr:ATP-binding protein [Lachnospiraceae bacterium]